MINLEDRLSELDVLLDYIDSEEWIKIPDEIIFYIKENKNKEYNWEYDKTKSLEEQNLNKDTFSLLTFIMYKYIATEEEKKEIDQLVKENTEELKKKYNVDNIFNQNNKNINTFQEKSLCDKTDLIKTKEENKTFWGIIISFIKKFLKK